MFKLTQTEKVEKFVTVFSNLKGFTEYVTLRLEEEKLFVQGMDSSHVSMFEINLSNDWFDEYSIEEEIVIGLSTDTLQKVLSTRKSQHGIMFKNVDQERIIISLFDVNNIDPKKKIYPKEFNISLVDLDIEEMHVPDQDHDVDIEFQSKQLKSLLDEVVLFNDTISFTCNDESVIFKCDSDTCSFQTDIPTEQLTYFSYREAPSLSFNVKYLHIFLQFNKLNENVWLHLNENSPLRCRYILDQNDKNNEKCHIDDNEEHKYDSDEEIELPSSQNTVTFYLAPKFEETQ